MYLRDNLKYSLGEREMAGLAAISRAGRRARPRAGNCGRCVLLTEERQEWKSSFFFSSVRRPTMDLASFEQRIAAGGRLTGDEALQLYRHAPTYWLGRMADQVRQRKHPEGLVTYIIDRNVNYTNVCVARCNFCAFYREVGHGEGYVLALRRDLQEDRRDARAGRCPAAAAGRAQSRSAARVVRGSVPRGEAAVPGFQAARAVAAGSPAHFAHGEAAGAGGDRAPDCRRPR